jgi:hypothetical protein
LLPGSVNFPYTFSTFYVPNIADDLSAVFHFPAATVVAGLEQGVEGGGLVDLLWGGDSLVVLETVKCSDRSALGISLGWVVVVVKLTTRGDSTDCDQDEKSQEVVHGCHPGIIVPQFGIFEIKFCLANFDRNPRQTSLGIRR